MIEKETRRPPSLVGPLLLVGLGVLLLLSNLGVIGWELWSDLWKLWPVVLILLGVEVLIGGRGSWGMALLVVAVLGVVALVSAFGWFWAPARVVGPTSGSGALVGPGSSFSQELGQARRGEVIFHFGAGSFSVGGGAAPGMLAEAAVSGGEDARIERSYQVRGDTGVLVLRSRERGFFVPQVFRERSVANRVDLRLSRDVPLTLDLAVGAADGVVDLTGLQVSNLKLDSGAAQTRVRFSDVSGTSEATVKGGAANLELTIPPDVAARITVKSGLANVDVDQARFPRSGGGYQSPDYDTAAKKLDLTVQVGMANVTIK